MGGTDGLFTPKDSITGLNNVMLELDEKTNRCFIKDSGEHLPW